MPEIRVSIIHQWWLDVDELNAILFKGAAQVLSNEFYPGFTDCSQTTFSADFKNLSSLDWFPKTQPIESFLRTAEKAIHLEIETKAIDPRIVSITLLL